MRARLKHEEETCAALININLHGNVELVESLREHSALKVKVYQSKTLNVSQFSLMLHKSSQSTCHIDIHAVLFSIMSVPQDLCSIILLLLLQNFSAIV